MATPLKIDLLQLEKTRRIYSDSIGDLQTAFEKADTAIELLKNSDWKSAASREFFKKYDDNWKANMNRQKQIIEHLQECLDYAQVDYEVLYEKVGTLGNAL